jgi:hypothetical protein
MRMGRILSFNEDNHEYQINGEVVPSVSEIIRFISREVYGEVAQYLLDTAADRGTRVHKATQMLDVVHEVECDDDITPYVRAYVNFINEHKPQCEFIEKSFFNAQKSYAGTVDRVGTFDGKITLVDIKTSSSIQKVLYGAQLNLYRMGLAVNQISVERLVILHLTKDGKYKIVEIPIEDEVANACLTLHKALKKKPRKKKGENNG